MSIPLSADYLMKYAYSSHDLFRCYVSCEFDLDSLSKALSDKLGMHSGDALTVKGPMLEGSSIWHA